MFVLGLFLTSLFICGHIYTCGTYHVEIQYNNKEISLLFYAATALRLHMIKAHSIKHVSLCQCGTYDTLLWE